MVADLILLFVRIYKSSISISIDGYRTKKKKFNIKLGIQIFFTFLM